MTTEETTTPAEAVPTVSTSVSEVRAGQTVRIHERIKDLTPKGEVRERIQIFEGIILGIKGSGISRTMTVRKISAGGFGVEKIYPLNSPVIAKVELVKTAHVRRAKLSFLQNEKRVFKRSLKERHENTTTKKKKGSKKK